MKSAAYLRKMNGSICNLEHLIRQFPREWLYFERRMRTMGLYSHEEPIFETFVDAEGSISEELVQEIRLWASNRTQTVARTIRGALTYHLALKHRFRWLEEELRTRKDQKMSTRYVVSASTSCGLCGSFRVVAVEPSTTHLRLSDLVELVISAQTYGNDGDDAGTASHTHTLPSRQINRRDGEMVF